MSNLITASTSAKDVRDLLASLGYGTVGTDLFMGSEPDGDGVQDKVITIYNTAPHGRSEINYCFEYPSVQVRMRWRANDMTAGEQRVLALMNALHGYVGTVNGISYHLIQVVNGPIPLGNDQRGRPRWTFNCDLYRSV